MRRRDRRHVEDFAIRGIAAVKVVAVPRSQADRAVIDVFLGHVDAAGDAVGFAAPVNSTALRHRLPRLDDARTCGNAVAWIDPAGATRAGCESAGCDSKDDKPTRQV